MTLGALQTDWSFFQESSRYNFQIATLGRNTTSLVAQNWSYSPIEATFPTSNSTIRWDAHKKSSLVSFSYTKTEDNNVLASFASPTVTVSNEKSYAGRINARHSFSYEGSLAQLGLQFVSWSNPTGQTSYAGYARKEETLSGYGNFEQKLLDDRLILDGSFRLDDHNVIVGLDQAGSTTRYFYNREFPVAVNHAAGATVKPVTQIALGGRYSHTEPSGRQLHYRRSRRRLFLQALRLGKRENLGLWAQCRQSEM